MHTVCTRLLVNVAVVVCIIYMHIMHIMHRANKTVLGSFILFPRGPLFIGSLLHSYIIIKVQQSILKLTPNQG